MEQALLQTRLPGYGRDTLARIKDAVTADGEVVIPIDLEAFGLWLKAAFSHPTRVSTLLKTEPVQSDNWTLPSIAVERVMPKVARFAMQAGCVAALLSWHMQRSGLLTSTARLVAYQCDRRHALSAGLATFSPFQRRAKRKTTVSGILVSAEITCSNTLDRIETIRSDANIGCVGPSYAALFGRLELFISDGTLVTH